MRKIVFIFLTIISLLVMISDVEAASKGEIDYEISNISINNNKTTVEGWAILVGHNNYGGVLTNIKLIAKSPNRSTTYNGTIELKDGENKYNNIANKTDNSYCYQRTCKQALDENGNPNIDPETGNYWLTDANNPPKFEYKGDCFYKKMYFTATFDTKNLKNLGSGVYFDLVVEYNTEHTKIDKCSVNDEDKATNKNILEKIKTGNYDWGYNANKTKIITVANNKCKVNGALCKSQQKLRINGKEIDLKITTGSTFRLNFANTVNNSPENDNKELVCENTRYESVNSEDVTLKFTASVVNEGTACGESHTCSVTVTKNFDIGSYIMVQTGDLKFELNRGPIHSGGNFTFGINYTNVARWYYNETPKCPAITLTGVNPYSKRTCPSGQTDPETKKCKVTKTCKKRCNGSITIYPENCQTDEDADKLFREYIISRYSGVKEKTTVKVKSDSNSIKTKDETKTVGTWQCGDVEDYKGNKITDTSTWEPGEEWITHCNYKLPNAKLNKKTADVAYNKNYTSDEWIDKGNSYFIPLKWPTSTFPINAELNGLSSIKGINWTAKYSCDVEVKQMFYDLDNGGYLFFYRPILLEKTFPNRTPSNNWINWWADESNRETLMNSYQNLEYTLDLTPSNLNSIREYNQKKLKESGNLGYLDYSINLNGTSSFFKNTFVSSEFKRNTTDYNPLGEVK